MMNQLPQPSQQPMPMQQAPPDPAMVALQQLGQQTGPAGASNPYNELEKTLKLRGFQPQQIQSMLQAFQHFHQRKA